MSIRYFIVGLQFFVVSVLANAQTLHSDSLTLDIFLEDFINRKTICGILVKQNVLIQLIFGYFNSKRNVCFITR